MRDSGRSTAEHLSVMLRQLLAELPPGVAELTSTDHGSDITLCLKPRNTTAASLVIRLDAASGWADLGLGVGIPAEIPPTGGAYIDGSQLEEIISFARAVIAGEFRETVWIRAGKVLKARGRIKLGDRWIRIRYGLILDINPFRRTQRLEHAYSPY